VGAAAGAVVGAPGIGAGAGGCASELNTTMGINRKCTHRQGNIMTGARQSLAAAIAWPTLPLRVFRNVRKQTDDRGGKTLPARRSARRQASPDQSSGSPTLGVTECLVQASQQFLTRQTRPGISPLPGHPTAPPSVPCPAGRLSGGRYLPRDMQNMEIPTEVSPCGVAQMLAARQSGGPLFKVLARQSGRNRARARGRGCTPSIGPRIHGSGNADMGSL